jgi:hypothetical protein
VLLEAVTPANRQPPTANRQPVPHFFFEVDFFEEDFLELDFFDDEDFFEDEDFFDDPFFDDDFFDGTLPPSARASDRPMAMACLRLVTFLPEPPLFSVPCLRSCMAFSTLSDAFFPYFDAIAKPPAQVGVQGSCAVRARLSGE